MASIVKRKNKYSVVYNYTDENGKKHQKWESFNTNTEAKKRKVQIEFAQEQGTLLIPEAKTLSELLEEYVSIYGVSKWALSTFESRRSLIANYINPIIGNMRLDEINTKVIDKYYQNLLKVKSKVVGNRKPNNEYVSPHIVREIHKLLRSAFNQAIKWEMTTKNPCINATLPKENHIPRKIWEAETLFNAIESCDDDLLKLALNLAFAASLRIGEILGLTWDCIEISKQSIESGKPFVYVNKVLQRVNKDALEKIGEESIIYKFPAVFARNTTLLVLKEPKTESSIRKVFIPTTVAKMLQSRYDEIQEYKELFGDEYIDYNLVFCNANGRPIEGQVINRGFSKLIRDNNLPPVVFHSLRHSSITYKLKINSGDIKSVQGDSGHSQAKMITEVYSHILDENRQFNAMKMEDTFYNKNTDIYGNPIQQSKSSESSTNTGNAEPNKPEINEESIISYFLSNPQSLDNLKSLLGIA